MRGGRRLAETLPSSAVASFERFAWCLHGHSPYENRVSYQVVHLDRDPKAEGGFSVTLTSGPGIVLTSVLCSSFRLGG